ncbi:MAG: formate dehydrogenase subunit alpha [Planctomycetes bacterium]|nr:formate dehydrogenase subunit alpha [Planctomycetota bacterium]
MIRLTIDYREVQARPGQTIMEAALAAGIEVPHLCHDPRLSPVGACRLCQVHVGGIDRAPVLACITQASEGMTVITESPELAARRKAILELLLSEHRVACTTCDADGGCVLQDLAYRYGADEWLYGAYQHGEPVALNYTSENRGIEYDAEKCVRCGRCVRFCDEVQMASAITFDGRGIAMKVNTAHGRPLHQSDCELCGGCIRVCPTGAMRERAAMGLGRAKDLAAVRTTCTYCGVGCQMDLQVNRRLNRIVRVTSAPGLPVNDGHLCVKGHFGFEFVNSPERLTDPLIREGDGFRTASWDEAIGLVGSRLRQIRDRGGPEALAFMSSCRCTNEENYLMQKLARAAASTNNVDQCATTCHAPTVAGLAAAFGSGAMTNSTREIRDCRVMFVIGCNATEAHPIVGLEMKRALRSGATLIVCDPRRTWLADHAHIFIQHRPGSDNMLINAMMSHIVGQGLYDRKFVAERCEDFDAFREGLGGYTVEKAARYCGVEPGLIRQAAELYARGAPSGIFYTLGITEHSCGTDNVKNLANLAMLCGQIGKPSSGINPLRGQNNVQGGCDMGAMPHRLPGYQDWKDPVSREKFQKAWGVKLPENSGGRVTHFIERAGNGEVKALYVMGEDPVMSEPNQTKVIAHLRKLDFLVCQEIFMSETARLAHVILPGACFAEKDGTFTCSERRVQRIRRAVAPPGRARPDWEILCSVSTAMGYPMNYPGPAEVFAELASLMPSYAGMNYARLEGDGLQWPCPTAEHPGTRFLHEGKFTRGKGLFHSIAFQPQKEEPDAEYPLILSTGRTLYHYNVGTMTRRMAVATQKQPRNFVEIHEDAAARYGIRDGQEVVVRSRRGRTTARAAVGRKVRPDTIWMPFHFVEESANALTIDAFDPVTATAEYKCCAARIEPSGPPEAASRQQPSR